jgi:hypothetical protein
VGFAPVHRCWNAPSRDWFDGRQSKAIGTQGGHALRLFPNMPRAFTEPPE